MTRRRRRTAYRGIAATIVVTMLLLLVAYRFLGPLTPAAVKERTVRALESGDAEALCRLADTEELNRLHLTPGNVASFLRATLWKDGLPRAKSERRSDEPEDCAVWVVSWHRATHESKAPGTVINVLDTPGRGWKLVLSELLRQSCFYHRPFGEAYAIYWPLARRCGISGLRNSRTGEYFGLDGNPLGSAFPG